MTPTGRGYLITFAGILLLVAGCLIFPRVLGFVELAARELRYLWWLILLVSIGVWLAFAKGSKK